MSILRTFKCQDENGEKSADFHIKFIHENYFDEAINFMNEIFLADEAMCKVRKFKEDQNAMKENSENWRRILSEKISIGCWKINKKEEKLVGVNFLYVKKKSESNEDPKVRKYNFLIKC